MKKLSGWIIIIFSTIILLSFLLTLGLLIPGITSNNSETQMSTKEIISSSIGFFIFIGLSIIGIIYGIKKIRPEKQNKLENYDNSLDIKFNGKIEYKNYRNLIIKMTFTKPFYFIRIGIIILVSLSLWVNEIGVFAELSSNIFGIIVLVLLLISPFLSLIRIKKVYDSNKLFHENLTYNLTNDFIRIKGNTIDTTLKWTGFIKVKETNQFYLFYQDKVIATLIEKKMLGSRDLKEFQEFVKSLSFKTD